MKGSIPRALPQRGQGGKTVAIRASSSFPTNLHRKLTSRRLPLMFDYLHPQPSHLLSLSLRDFLPGISAKYKIHTTLPSVSHRLPLPPGHHLVYFPPQLPLSQILPDGTDTLHTPGEPFNRRLWAGGKVQFTGRNRLVLDGSRAVCTEAIRDVIVKGQEGEEKIIVEIERRIGSVREEEDEDDIRNRMWTDGAREGGRASVIETRNLVFMREKTPQQLAHDKANFHQNARSLKNPTDPEFRQRIAPTTALLFRFSALTFNAHSIHLDKGYTQNVEGYRGLLVHGPLTLTLLLAVVQHHLAQHKLTIKEIDYRNLTPLYVEDDLLVCGKPKPGKDNAVWDVWIEGKGGGLAVRGTVQTNRAR